MSHKETKAPAVETSEKGTCHEKDTYTHDAYGNVTLTVQTVGGGGYTLFGSDIGHGQVVSIKVARAKLDRHLANDWIHADDPIVEFRMSHSQFAEFITSNGRGGGTPCTLAYAPERGTPTKQMPGIENIETKAETFRREIKESASKQIENIDGFVSKLGEMLEGGSLSKKELKALQFSMRCAVQNMPSNMAYTVAQAEEALEKATTAAKIEVEAFIQHQANKLGLEAAKNIGLVASQQPKELDNL